MHFSVLVAGEYPEELIAPYEVGNDDYAEDHHEVVGEWELNFWKEQAQSQGEEINDNFDLWTWLTRGDEEDTEELYWHGHEQCIYRVTYNNPNGKWDWYSIGGRWSGFIKLKPGAVTHNPPINVRDYPLDHWDLNDLPGEDEVNQARKHHINIPQLRMYAIIKAREELRWYQERLLEYGAYTPRPTYTLGEGRDDYQQRMTDWRALDNTRAWQDAIYNSNIKPDLELMCSVEAEEYVTSARTGAFCAHAFLSEGSGWLESNDELFIRDARGNLGYQKAVEECINNAGLDTLFTIVDCHY